MMRRPIGLLVCLVLVSCSGGGEDTVETNDAVSTTDLAVTSSTADGGSTTNPGIATGLEAVEPDLAEHATWFLRVLSTGELEEEDYQNRFTQSFRDQIPYEALAPSLAPLTSEGWVVTEVITNEDAYLQVDITPTEGEPVLRMSLRIDDSGKMSKLSAVVAPITELEDPPQSFEEATEQLGEFGDVTLLAADAAGGECVAVEEVAADKVIPIGSVFKLWILAALADAVEGGEVSWDDTLTVTDEIKSLPSGRLQDEPAGTTVTVEEAALAMISISDNTATDMLMDLLEREEIEGSLEGRMATPSLNVPFLTTREMFILKMGDEERLADYVATDESGRRAVLEGIAGEALPGMGSIPTEPVAINEVEWFATSNDICEMMKDLVSRFDDPGLGPLREILTTNPGVPTEEGRWDTVAFKGGSENGVLVTTWYLEGADGAFVLVSSVTNAEETFRPDRPTLIMAAARDLLANPPR